MDARNSPPSPRPRSAAREPEQQRTPPFGLWLLAARPKTLLLSVTPVVAGTALALIDHGAINSIALALALIAAIAIQIGTNLWNDACDGASGLDDHSRIGPMRVTAAGLITARRVHGAALIAFAVASLCGLGLIVLGGWPILVIGVASLLCAVLYSSGPWPIAATPFGEVFVFIFFGLAAVAGTYYLHAGTVTPRALLLGAVVGLPAAAVLLVNNHRDRVSDARNGRKTLAIIAGVGGARILYGALLVAALAAATILAAPSCALGWLVLAPAMALTAWQSLRFARHPIDAGLNRMLAATAGLQAVLAASALIAILPCAAG